MLGFGVGAWKVRGVGPNSVLLGHSKFDSLHLPPLVTFCFKWTTRPCPLFSGTDNFQNTWFCILLLCIILGHFWPYTSSLYLWPTM